MISLRENPLRRIRVEAKSDPLARDAMCLRVPIASEPPEYIIAVSKVWPTGPKQLPGCRSVAMEAWNRRFGMDH